MLFEDRSRAESFGNVAQLYDRARPTYPPELVEWLLSDGARRVLDVGCGTGIAGALFAARGCEVTGVEVDARMAAVAQTKGLDVEVSSFEQWDDRGRRFELAISAQAWHWIEPRAGAAKAAAVLSDRGRIGCFWNLGDPPAEVRERLAPVYDRLGPKLANLSRSCSATPAAAARTPRPRSTNPGCSTQPRSDASNGHAPIRPTSGCR